MIKNSLMFFLLVSLIGCDVENIGSVNEPTAPTEATVPENNSSSSSSESEKKEEVKPNKPQPKTPVKKLNCSKYVDGQDGPSGFVNNPDNGHHTFKVVLPTEYTDRIVEVVVWSEKGKFIDRLHNEQPNEYDNRERYYGSYPINEYPKNVIVGWKLLKGKVICVKLPNPQVRVD